MVPLTAALLVLALAAAAAPDAGGGGPAGQYVHPVNCLCRPTPSTPQTAFCSRGALSRVPRCVASDVADLHLAYPLVHSVLPEVFVSSEFYRLQVVLFDHNRVGYLVGDEFWEMPHLFAVDLSHNILEGPLPPDLFERNNIMHHLDLSHNLGLGMVHDNSNGSALVTSATLLSLDISHCGLVNLSTNTSALQHLTASWNSIGDLAPGTFANMSELAALDLSHNVLRSLADQAFKGLTKLTDLNLSYNMLEGPLPADLQTSCPELLHLDLSHNTKLGPSIDGDEMPLISSSTLQFVNVTHCGLVRLSLDTPAIQRLNASFNSISEVHDVTLSAMHNLTVLDLSHNKLKIFSLSLPSVRVLNLSNNAIERLDRDTFGEMPELTVLDLASNKITVISSIILPGLKVLNISGNALTFFTDSVISENASRMVLDLSYNKLTEVKISLDYEELFLGENPFICSCTMLRQLGEWLRRTAVNKTRRCWEPKRLRGLLWTHFLSNQYCANPEKRFPETIASSTENLHSTSVKDTTIAVNTAPSLTSESIHQEKMKGSAADEDEEGMSAYNATMVALVVWGLVAYPCVVALRRACRHLKRHRPSVAPCVAGCRDDAGGGGTGGGTRGGARGDAGGGSDAQAARPPPPPRPTTLALPPQGPPRPPPPRPAPPPGYDVLQFEAPRFRTPLPHYQQVVTPTPTPTPTSEDSCELQPLCCELSERAPPNVYVQDPLQQPRLPERVDEPVYAEIYDVVRR